MHWPMKFLLNPHPAHDGHTRSLHNPGRFGKPTTDVWPKNSSGHHGLKDLIHHQPSEGVLFTRRPPRAPAGIVALMGSGYG
jgi:hypothetical protein